MRRRFFWTYTAFILSLISLCSVAWMYRTPLMMGGVKAWLGRSFPRLHSWELSYDTLSWQRGALQLEGVKLSCGTHPLLPLMEGDASRIAISPHFSFPFSSSYQKKGFFYCDVEVDLLHIAMEEEFFSLVEETFSSPSIPKLNEVKEKGEKKAIRGVAPSKKKKKQPLALLRGAGNVVVKEGKLSFFGGNSRPPLHFSLVKKGESVELALAEKPFGDDPFRDLKEGIAEGLYLGAKRGTNGDINEEGDEGPKGFVIARHLNLFWLSSYVPIKAISGWEVREGTVEGRGVINFFADPYVWGCESVEGFFRVHELAAISSQVSVEGGVDELRFSYKAPHVFHKTEEELIPWWQQIFIDMHIQNGGMSCYYAGEEEDLCMEVLEGDFHMEKGKITQSLCKGNVTKGLVYLPFSLMGEGDPSSIGWCGYGEWGDASIDLIFEKKAPLGGSIECRARELQKEHIETLLSLCAPHLLKRFEIQKSSLGGTLYFAVKNRSIASIALHDLVIRDLLFTVPEQGIEVHCPLLGGNVHWNGGDAIWRPSSWEVKSHSGSVVIDRQTLPLKVSDITLSMEGQGNLFGPSEIEARTLGGTYHALISNTLDSPSLSNHFEGDCRDLLPHFKQFFGYEGVEEELSSAWDQDVLQMDLQLDKREGKWLCGGDVRYLHRPLGSHKKDNTFTFGCVLHRSNKWRVMGGWFRGKHLHLSSLPWGALWSFHQGDVSLVGTFDHKEVITSIEGKGIAYAPDKGEKAPAIFSLDIPEGEEGKAVYNFSSKHYTLTIPFVDTSCHAWILPFKNSSGLLLVENEEILLSNFEGFSGGMYVAGEVRGNRKTGEWHFETEQVLGDMSHLRSLLQGAFHSPIWTLPLEGELVSGRGGLSVTLFPKKRGEKRKVDCRVSCDLMRGEYRISHNSAIEGISCSLFWDAGASVLGVTELVGVWNREGEEQSYLLQGKKVECCWGKEPSIDFDLRLGKETYDLFHLVGHSDLGEGGKIKVALDRESSHFFSVGIQKCEALLHPNLTLSSLEVISQANLRSNLNILEFATEFFPAANSQWGALPRLPLTGQVGMNFTYKEGNSLFTLNSDGVRYGEQDLGEVSVAIEGNEQAWELKHLRLGDLYMSGAWTHHLSRWAMPRVYIAWKGSYIDLSRGEYLEIAKRGDVKLNALHLIFEELKEAPLFGSLLDSHFLGGELHLQGGIEMSTEKGWKEPCITLEIQGHGERLLEMGRRGEGSRLAMDKPMRITYTPSKGVEIKEIELSLLPHKMPRKRSMDPLKISASRLVYQQKGWRGEGIHFALSPEILRTLGEMAIIPNFHYCDGQLCLGGLFLPWDNAIDFVFDWTYDSLEGNQIEGSMGDGYYWIGADSWLLEKGRYRYGKGTVDLSWDATHRDMALQVMIKHSLHKNSASKVVLHSGKSSTFPREPLVMEYHHDNKGWVVDKIRGTLFGCRCAFSPNVKNSNHSNITLTGKISLDRDSIDEDLFGKWKTQLQKMKIGGNYELEGDFILVKHHWGDSYFKGNLKARDFHLFGHHLRNFLTRIRVAKGSFFLSNLKMSDGAGTLEIPEVSGVKMVYRGWQLDIPKILLQDFRPSLLRSPKKENPSPKPFMIKKLEFSGIQGILGRPYTFKGKGEIDFVNTFQKTPRLFDLPMEMVYRLGLDIGLLIPIGGKIDCEISGGKVVFTDLRDSFSQGNRSQFFLTEGAPSYIDFSGRMAIDIRMKQYVLLKFTEAFTLSLRGDMAKPRISLNPSS